jgi:ankyrin repeat protein
MPSNRPRRFTTPTVAIIATLLTACTQSPEQQWADMQDAVRNNDGRRIERLIRSGVDPNQKLANDMTLICEAAFRGKQAAVEALLAGGADPAVESVTGQNRFTRFVASAVVCAQLGARDPRNAANNADYEAIQRLLRSHDSK